MKSEERRVGVLLVSCPLESWVRDSGSQVLNSIVVHCKGFQFV